MITEERMHGGEKLMIYFTLPEPSRHAVTIINRKTIAISRKTMHAKNHQDHAYIGHMAILQNDISLKTRPPWLYHTFCSFKEKNSKHLCFIINR